VVQGALTAIEPMPCEEARPPSIGIERLSKSYGGTQALKDVSIRCRAGDVHAIAGENGAGKSTLMKILAGVVPAGQYHGVVRLAGEPVSFANVRDAEAAGVFLVPQELHVVPELTIADFLFLNREPANCGFVDRRRLWLDTRTWLSAFHLPLSPLTLMGELSSHEQQLISIARAMSQGLKILILDEPTASLTGQETDLLFNQIRIFRERGVTVLYISHRLAELERIADAVTVLRDGQIVDGFRRAEEPEPIRRIIRGMIGRDVKDMYPKTVAQHGDVALSIEDWTVSSPNPDRPNCVQSLSLEVHAGEVLGIFGLIGSGSSDLGRSLFAAHQGASSGRLLVAGRVIAPKTARDAVAAGIAYLPSDRKREGLVLPMSVGTNLTLAALDSFARAGIVNRRREASTIREFIANLRIKCSSPDQPAADLSGGNQQKIVVAKWLITKPTIFVMDEPTRGVDVAARLEIYELINLVVAGGGAVIMISTDAAEVLGMSDRVIAMRDGHAVGEWPRGDVGEEALMLHAAGRSEAGYG
jgi:ABC-type sugar transport system ATPase subunit